MRKKQRHIRVIDRKYFRVYYSGAYALLEIDFGRTAHGEFVLLFGCVDKPINYVYNKRITKEVHYVV